MRTANHGRDLPRLPLLLDGPQRVAVTLIRQGVKLSAVIVTYGVRGATPITDRTLCAICREIPSPSKSVRESTAVARSRPQTSMQSSGCSRWLTISKKRPVTSNSGERAPDAGRRGPNRRYIRSNDDRGNRGNNCHDLHRGGLVSLAIVTRARATQHLRWCGLLHPLKASLSGGGSRPCKRDQHSPFFVPKDQSDS